MRNVKGKKRYGKMIEQCERKDISLSTKSGCCKRLKGSRYRVAVCIIVAYLPTIVFEIIYGDK